MLMCCTIALLSAVLAKVCLLDSGLWELELQDLSSALDSVSDSDVGQILIFAFIPLRQESKISLAQNKVRSVHKLL